MTLKKIILILMFLPMVCIAERTVNVYVWGGEIPLSLIKKFETETKIKVNFSTFESNESLFAKLKTNNDFDVILPSSYLIQKLIKNHALMSLDKSKLPHIKNINPAFLNLVFDSQNIYSLPLTFGATGIFLNKKHHGKVSHWQQLWDKKQSNKLLLMDDPREVFAISLISLGYSPNDTNLIHLKEAYEKLKKLRPNIKLLSSNTIQGLIIDEEATLGMAWNGDIMKVSSENTHITLSHPQEGFVLWIDCLAILKKAPHPIEAHKFINFMFDGKNAAEAMLSESMSTTNLSAKKYLPAPVANSELMYPSKETLKRGTLLSDIGQTATKQLLHDWQQFKLGF